MSAVSLAAAWGAASGLLALALAACSGDLPELARGALVSCGDGGACPARFSCNASAGLCVPEGTDVAAPAVVPGSVTLVLSPPPGCPSAAVTALGPRGRAEVSFTASKPLAEPPVLLARSGDVARPTLPSEQQGSSYFYHLTVPQDAPEGPWTLSVTLIDAARNRVEAELAPPVSLVVDTAAPPAPTAEGLERILLRLTANGGAEVVEGAQDAVLAGARVQVFAAPDAGGGLLAEVDAAADGSFSVPLPPGDRPAVALAVTDAACNYADGTPAPVLVPRVEWTARPARGVGVPQATARLEVRPWHLDVLVQSAARYEMTLPDEGLLETVGAGSWRRGALSPPPGSVAANPVCGTRTAPVCTCSPASPETSSVRATWRSPPGMASAGSVPVPATRKATAARGCGGAAGTGGRRSPTTRTWTAPSM